MDTQQKLNTVNGIKTQELAINIAKGRIDTLKELIANKIETKQEWLDLESAKEEVKRYKLKLDQLLAGDSDYNNQLEDLAQLKDKLKSEKEALSDLVVGYALETKERQLEIDNTGDARNIIIKGSLGKKAKYQTNLFADRA